MLLIARWFCPVCHRWSTTHYRPDRHFYLTRTGKPRKCRGRYVATSGMVEIQL